MTARTGMTDFEVTSPRQLGAAIRARRRSLHITQEELSLQTGISRPTIRAIEQGKETAQVGLAIQICNDLGMALVLSIPEAVI